MERLLTWRWAIPSIAALLVLPYLLGAGLVGILLPLTQVGVMAAAVYGRRRATPTARRSYEFIIAGEVFLLITGIDLILGGDLHVSPVGVATVGVASLFFMGSALHLLTVRRPRYHRDGLVDGLAAVTGVLAIQWQFQHSTGSEALGRIGELMVPVFIGVIGFGVIVIAWRLMFDKNSNRLVSLCVVGAAGAKTVAILTTQTYTDATPPPYAFSAAAIAGLLLAVAVLHPDYNALFAKEDDAPKRLPIMRWLGPAAALVVSPAMLFLLLARQQAPSLPVAAAAFALTAIVLWRIGRLLHDREEGRKELHSSEQRFRSLVQYTSDVIAVLDSDRRVTYLSGGFEELLGFPPQDLIGKRVTSLLDPVDLDSVRQALMGATEPDVARPMGRDIRLRRPDGDFRWVSVMVTNQQHNPSIGGWVLNVHDVTERKLAEKELSRLALHDSLTGLPNRAQLRQILAENVATYPGGTALLFCDLDGFKAVNDLLGHERGDEVLQAVAGRWSAQLRADDVLGRWGGDEFLVVCPMVGSVEEAMKIADRLLATLRAPLDLHGATAQIGCSIGLAVHVPEEDVETLIGRADAAMYDAKRASGGLRLA